MRSHGSPSKRRRPLGHPPRGRSRSQSSQASACTAPRTTGSTLSRSGREAGTCANVHGGPLVPTLCQRIRTGMSVRMADVYRRTGALAPDRVRPFSRRGEATAGAGGAGSRPCAAPSCLNCSSYSTHGRPQWVLRKSCRAWLPPARPRRDPDRAEEVFRALMTFREGAELPLTGKHVIALVTTLTPTAGSVVLWECRSGCRCHGAVRRKVYRRGDPMEGPPGLPQSRPACRKRKRRSRLAAAAIGVIQAILHPRRSDKPDVIRGITGHESVIDVLPRGERRTRSSSEALPSVDPAAA